MSVHELRDQLAGLPAEAMVPVGWVRRQLGAEDVREEPTIDYTVADVAKLVGRTANTVRSWIRAGKLDAYEFMGRQKRITSEALSRFQEAQRRPSKNDPRVGGDIDLSSWRRISGGDVA